MAEAESENVNDWKKKYAIFVVEQEKGIKWMRENKKPVCLTCMRIEWDFRQTPEGKKRNSANVVFNEFIDKNYVFIARQERMERTKNKLKDLKTIEYKWKCENKHTTSILYTEEEEKLLKK